MAHGGARPGTGPKAEPEAKRKMGRPAKPRTNEEKNAAFDEKAIAVLPELFDTILTIATGYKVAVTDRPRKLPATEMQGVSGEPIWVYSVPPDKAAAMYLIDRAAGKAAVKNPEQTETELILEFVMPSEEPTDDDIAGSVSGGPGEWG